MFELSLSRLSYSCSHPRQARLADVIVSHELGLSSVQISQPIRCERLQVNKTSLRRCLSVLTRRKYLINIYIERESRIQCLACTRVLPVRNNQECTRLLFGYTQSAHALASGEEQNPSSVAPVDTHDYLIIDRRNSSSTRTCRVLENEEFSSILHNNREAMPSSHTMYHRR